MFFSDSGFTVFHRIIEKYIDSIPSVFVAALDSLVLYAAVLSIARQRFVETLRYLKKLEKLPSSPSALYFEQASLSFPTP